MEAETAATTSGFFETWSKKWQYVMDKSSPHVAFRWVGFTVVFLLYFLRVYLVNGWFIVTYGLGIYLLNQLIGFLSPQVSIFICTFNLEIWHVHFISSLTLKKMNSILVYQLKIARSIGDTAMNLFLNSCIWISNYQLQNYRPFARRLPEFKFWYSCIRSVVISFFMTFFQIFDIPVFWPILLLYFIVLFFITMKRQIKHMIKHKYVPFSWGKTRYVGKQPVAKEAK